MIFLGLMRVVGISLFCRMPSLEGRWAITQSVMAVNNEAHYGNEHLRFGNRCYAAPKLGDFFLKTDSGYVVVASFVYRKKFSVKCVSDTIYVNSVSEGRNDAYIKAALDEGDALGKVFLYVSSSRTVVVWRDDKNECDFIAKMNRRYVTVNGRVGGLVLHVNKRGWNKLAYPYPLCKIYLP